MKWSIRQRIGAGYAAAALLIVVIGVTAYRNIGTMRDTAQWVTRTHQMKQHIESILSFLQDAETGQRGFVITGQDGYLEPYRTGVREVPREVARIRALTPNPMQRANLDRLDPLIAAKFAELRETIDLRRKEGFNAALPVVAGGAGKQTMDEIRVVLATMDSVQNVLLAEREGAAQRSATATVVVIIAGTLVALAVVVFLAYFITQHISDAYDRLTHEVGERERAEGDLKELSTTLEQRVKERTAELEASRIVALNMMEGAEEARRTAETALTERKRAEEELRHTLEDLACSNAELEQFAYVASHDLQEPLRMVASYTQLLADRYGGRLDADADDFIGFAVDGAQRMQSLIEGLLAYSRVATRGKEVGATDSGAAVDEALDVLQAAIEESGAVVVRDSLPTVRADGQQLARVFQNLLGNAIKFRRNGRPEIHVGAERKDDNWVFWVRDNGPGIEPEYAERIFVIFQQLHPKSAHPGTGMGLAICKRIVERHGGCIWMDSQLGKGSTFYFTIPDKG